MTLEQMREFVIVAEERNYLVAAHMLFSTQATLSRHIIAMEKELGFPLFTRSTKKIELTHEGSRFLVYARKAMKLQDEYQTELEYAKRRMSESLTVGYNNLAAFYQFTDKLTQFITGHPTIPIQMIEDDTELLIKAVQNGSCDLAFIMEDPFHHVENLSKLPISVDTLDAVLPANHPLAGRDCLELRELENEKFAVGIEDKIPGIIFMEACSHAGFEPQISRNGLVGPALFTWIGSGSGCVGLEWHVPGLRHKTERTRLVPISPPVRAYTTIIYQHKNLSNSGRLLIDYFLSDKVSEEGAR